MRAAIGIGDGVGITKNLIVVAVVVLQDNVDEHLVPLCRHNDRLGVHHCLVTAQLPHKLLNAVAVEKCLRLFVFALVDQIDFHTGIQERQFA